MSGAFFNNSEIILFRYLIFHKKKYDYTIPICHFSVKNLSFYEFLAKISVLYTFYMGNF